MNTERDPYADFTDGRIKHLDMVQAVVARLGSNGFVIKGWAVTVAGAFLGFGITRENGWLALAGVLPSCLFWFLDASFLRSERAFRLLTKGGDNEIRKWIDGQLSGRSCAVVLIGKDTAGRKWINYEIKKAWNDKKGLVGIHIHNLLDSTQQQTTKGNNPFATFTLNEGKTKLSSVVNAYDPPYSTSTNVYDHIKSNLEAWVEEAVDIRNNYKPS